MTSAVGALGRLRHVDVETMLYDTDVVLMTYYAADAALMTCYADDAVAKM